MSWQLGGGGERNVNEGMDTNAPNGGNVNGNNCPIYVKDHKQPDLRWGEVLRKVKEMRRSYSNLFIKSPSSMKFRKISDDTVRIYFLLSPAQGREATLYYVDYNTNMSGCPTLQETEVLDASSSFLYRRASCSREEQLLSERRRCSVWGITHYQLHPETGMVVFPACSTIFFCKHPVNPGGQIPPKEMPNNKVRLYPQLSSAHPHLMALSLNRDVYVYNTHTGIEYRISHCQTPDGGRLENKPLSAGVPTYVMQEEFFRYQGYWWQPQSKDGVPRLLYEEVDESKVVIMQFMSLDQSVNSLEELRFPRAGTHNATSSLRIAELTHEGALSRLLHLKPTLAQIAPWYQYLVRVGWTPCGKFVWCQLLDRRQHRLDLILLPLGLFTPVQLNSTNSCGAGMASSTPLNLSSTMPTAGCSTSQGMQSVPPMGQHPLSPSGGNSQQPFAQFNTNAHHQNGSSNPFNIPYTILSDQQDQAWVEVHNLLYWYKSDEGPMKRLIWANESTGYRHLYFYRVRLAGAGAVQVNQKVALTSGDWAVYHNKGPWVDEENGLVYFMAFKDTPLEQHLYVVSIQQRQNGTINVVGPQRLTELGYTHNAFVSTRDRIFITTYSSTKFPRGCHLYRINPPEVPGQIVSVQRSAALLSLPVSDTIREMMPVMVPDIVPVDLPCGTTVYSMIFKPHNFDPNKKYPIVLHIYGGPQVQLVTNTFKGCRHMRSHMLATLGFCVISIDSRGSDNRGLAFQSHIKNRMGTVEISDQVNVLQRLAERYSYLNIDRVGVFGWSYGGYLSLMAIAQRGDIFKVAIAGAPVVNWLYYDTGYTERYMDTPEHNTIGYKNSSVLNFVKDFPDDSGRLLLVQGIIDENVHFCHINSLVQSLVSAGKPYNLQVYTRERHSLRALDSNEHYETELLHFLLKGL